ncbi:MAG: hypothetical protein IJM12_05435 [Bacteroidales bacterium]|nr:hypothetical protein [Bacteroidales bacterium]
MGRRILVFLCLAFMVTIAGCAKIEIYDDISHYSEYMSFESENADPKWNKWGMDESIWPQRIQDTSQVSDFKMVYYDPWDKQYLGYLVIDYSDDDYASEVDRLKEYPSTDYIGYYDVQKEETYELLAVNADKYLGFVYALTDGKNRIIYAEQIFCNYFMDIDYEKYIKAEYLLDGFNAKPDNPYEKRMTNK